MRHDEIMQHETSELVGIFDNVITYQYNGYHRSMTSTQSGSKPTTTKYYYSH